MRDPHYRKILEGLAGPLDPQLFEECAVDLLRDVYPGLVPIHGGQDAGMDGAISDGEGEPYPLVATTSEDVPRNLAGSLDSNLHRGGRRRRVVVATSTRLTPPFQRKVRDLARDKGFDLVGLHERYDLADRLYRNSRWTEDLLGLSGQPSALSALSPESRRPLLEIELLGRDADLRWLLETSGDRVIVGQPGSGKTYLLQQLVREDGALFLASDDSAAIANAARDHRPTAVLVDDAHVAPERLARLRHLRLEIGADFDIVASAWPGAENDVADALAVENSQEKVLNLDLLTLKEIVDVLRAVGVVEREDSPSLHLLVRQSANKPGLAVLLGTLWLRGQWEAVLTGRALRSSLLPGLKRILGHDPAPLLACFALGGDEGVSMDVVGEFLDLGREDVLQRATLASQGGLLRVLPRGELVVEPESLRTAVLDAIFFSGSGQSRRPTLRFGDLLALLPRTRPAVNTLVLAALNGVQIPRDQLQELVSKEEAPNAWQISEPNPWRRFAMLGPLEAEWVAREYPGEFEHIADAILEKAPRTGVRHLLRLARAAQGPLHSDRRHPLRLLQEWLKSIPDYTGDSVSASLERRRLVVECAKACLCRSPVPLEVLRACVLALSPDLEDSREAATRDRVVMRRALLPADACPEMIQLWAQVRVALGEWTPVLWSELQNMLQVWAFPALAESLLDGRESYRDVARQMVRDLAARASEHPGMCLCLESWATKLDVSLQFDVDPEFRLLNPMDTAQVGEDRTVRLSEERRMARKLAADWAKDQPREIANRIAFFEQEAQVFLDNRYGWHVQQELHDALAELVESPLGWVEAFVERVVSSGWIDPLLCRTVREGLEGRRALSLCMDSDAYSWLAAQVAIRRPETPGDILHKALAAAPSEVLVSVSLRGDLPLASLRSLMQHDDDEVAAAAAIGEWVAPPRGEIRRVVESEWRTAVLRIGSNTSEDRLSAPVVGFWLKQMLSEDVQLAAAWLSARLENEYVDHVIRDDGVYAAAIRALPEKVRIDILNLLENEFRTKYLVALLIDRMVDVYRHLIDRSDLRQYHLVPIQGGPPDSAWRQLASLALDAGYSPREIAAASYEPVFPVSIPIGEVDYWRPWRDGFQGLVSCDDLGLREIGRHGLAQVELLEEEARSRRRSLEVTGTF